MRRIPTSFMLTMALALTSGTAWAQQQFSGTWQVEAITERGNCDKVYRYPVVVENGTVRSTGQQSVSVSGRVQPDGRLQSSIQRTMARADARGRLSDRSGSGTWTTSGSLSCSGRWRAEKRS
jgi:hypothetical protein